MPDLMRVKPLAKGSKGTDETWCDWWVFPRLTDEQAEHMAYDVLNLSQYNGHPGGCFTRKPIIRQRGQSYTLIFQRGGMDI